jgi:hypothetical protein
LTTKRNTEMQAVRAPLLRFDALYRGEILVLKGLPSVSALVTERQVSFVSVSTFFDCLRIHVN